MFYWITLGHFFTWLSLVAEFIGLDFSFVFSFASNPSIDSAEVDPTYGVAVYEIKNIRQTA